MIALNAVVLATLVLVATNDLDLSSALFECVSAFSTTGLSTGDHRRASTRSGRRY